MWGYRYGFFFSLFEKFSDVFMWKRVRFMVYFFVRNWVVWGENIFEDREMGLIINCLVLFNLILNILKSCLGILGFSRFD